MAPGCGRPLDIDSMMVFSMGPTSWTYRGDATHRTTVSSISF